MVVQRILRRLMNGTSIWIERRARIPNFARLSDSERVAIARKWAADHNRNKWSKRLFQIGGKLLATDWFEEWNVHNKALASRKNSN